jgi:hypothetical protein
LKEEKALPDNRPDVLEKHNVNYQKSGMEAVSICTYYPGHTEFPGLKTPDPLVYTGHLSGRVFGFDRFATLDGLQARRRTLE